MTIKTHRLKIKPEYFTELLSGSKTFEVRIFDREYEVMDYITFDVVFPYEIQHHPHQFQITYILTYDDFPEGIKEGYCVLGIKEVKE